MWVIAKIDKKKFPFLKKDFYKKLGNDVKLYSPKIRLKKIQNKKISIKENFLLGDYLLCFHKGFTNKSIIESLKYCTGLKYFLTDFFHSQCEIEKFINKCKENEDENGFIKSSFFDFENKKKFQFISGPFNNMIFSVLKQNRLSIKALIGNFNITVSKEENFFRPV